MEILIKDLSTEKDGEVYKNGYRLVYFENNDKYSVGAYCKTIEGLMMTFVTEDPILSESDIPPFVSTDDILERCLNLFDDILGVAIYKVDGTCICKKYRKNL